MEQTIQPHQIVASEIYTLYDIVYYNPYTKEYCNGISIDREPMGRLKQHTVPLIGGGVGGRRRVGMGCCPTLMIQSMDLKCNMMNHNMYMNSQQIPELLSFLSKNG